MNKLTPLRLARLTIGKSQHEVQAETGIHQSELSLFERGLKCPKQVHLEALADCYNTEPDKLGGE